MAVPFDALKTKVKYVGVFDLKDFYRNIRDLLQDKGYVSSESYKFMETYYQERVNPDPKRGKEMWIWWRTSKAEERTTYVRQHCDVDFHMRFIHDIEVMDKGKKVRAQKGEIEINFHGYIVLDPDDAWEKHWFLKQIHPLFYERIWAKRRETNINTVRNDVYKFQQYVKDYLGLKQFGATTFPFYPTAPLPPEGRLA
ncbi:hypothetical protein HY488_01595 [Candidatus Woesearchaeota archaeon]|nr:hypothetical protein [Candidatus Woesearchaeota archaeon]